MGGYRDETEALRARVAELERELAAARAERSLARHDDAIVRSLRQNARVRRAAGVVLLVGGVALALGVALGPQLSGTPADVALAALGVLGVALLLAAWGLFLRSVYVRATLDEALVVTGPREPRVLLPGGAMFAWPVLTAVAGMSLAPQQVRVTLSSVRCHGGDELATLYGSVLARVRGDTESVRRAAERFGGDEARLRAYVEEHFAQVLRSAFNSLPVDALDEDYARCCALVEDELREALSSAGLELEPDSLRLER